jgi:hypothetical protein
MQPAEHRLAFPAKGQLGRLSAFMCVVVAIGGALAELVLCWVWLAPSLVEELVVPRLGLGAVPVSLDAGTRLLGFAISMLPMAALLYILHQAYELFDAFRLGNVLTRDVPMRLRRIGLGLVVLSVLRPLATTLLGLALTWQNAPGHRVFAVGLSIDDYMIATLGGLLLAIGYAMAEAARLADDHRQIV